MSERPKRPWFRFHLLTLMLMTVATGGLMGLNMNPPRPPVISHPVYGWPIYLAIYDKKDSQWYFREDQDRYTVIAIRTSGDPAAVYDLGFGSWQYVAGHWTVRALLPNIALWFSMLALVAFLSEIVIRHREDRKP